MVFSMLEYLREASFPNALLSCLKRAFIFRGRWSRFVYDYKSFFTEDEGVFRKFQVLFRAHVCIAHACARIRVCVPRKAPFIPPGKIFLPIFLLSSVLQSGYRKSGKNFPREACGIPKSAYLCNRFRERNVVKMQIWDWHSVSGGRT